MKIEEAIEDIKAHLIDLCAFPNYEEDNYNAGYIAAIDENTSEIFKAGVEFTQRWISIEDELPEDTQEILMKNIDWKNEYYSEGVRSGWYNPTHCKYYTSLWDDNKEEFVTSESTPTHWRPIELK